MPPPPKPVSKITVLSAILKKENIFASLLGNQKKHYINSEIKEYLGSYYNSFKALENIKDANCIQARMPFDPNIQ